MNRRPLGYEREKGCVGNPLIFRKTFVAITTHPFGVLRGNAGAKREQMTRWVLPKYQDYPKADLSYRRSGKPGCDIPLYMPR